MAGKHTLINPLLKRAFTDKMPHIFYLRITEPINTNLTIRVIL